MNSVTDICRHQFLCFVTIIQVKARQGNLRSTGRYKRSNNKKNRDLELRYMFLGQIFAKHAINDPKTLFEASKSAKKI